MTNRGISGSAAELPEKSLSGNAGVPVDERARSRWILGEMVGRSSSMERLFLQMRYLARHMRLALIEGEPGTGKLLVSRTLHTLALPHAPFVHLTGEQFFGGPRPGELLAQAAGGTLYISEAELLSPDAQARLLHLVEWLTQKRSEGETLPSAAPRILLVGARQPLRPLVLQGRMRADLYHMLSPVSLVLPPLRERYEDLGVLVRHLTARNGWQLRALADEAQNLLYGHPWPGNVRELESVLGRGARSASGEWIRASDIVFDSTPPLTPVYRKSVPLVKAAPAAPQPVTPGHDPNLDRAIQRHVREVLSHASGNKLRAARLLGISRSTLYRLLEDPAGAAAERPQ